MPPMSPHGCKPPECPPNAQFDDAVLLELLGGSPLVCVKSPPSHGFRAKRPACLFFSRFVSRVYADHRRAMFLLLLSRVHAGGSAAQSVRSALKPSKSHEVSQSQEKEQNDNTATLHRFTGCTHSSIVRCSLARSPPHIYSCKRRYTSVLIYSHAHIFALSCARSLARIFARSYTRSLICSIARSWSRRERHRAN